MKLKQRVQLYGQIFEIALEIELKNYLIH